MSYKSEARRYGTYQDRLAWVEPGIGATFFEEDTLNYYLYDETWHKINGSGTGGMEIHGNEYHEPDYATPGDINSAVGTHESTYNHSLLHSNALDHANTNDPGTGEKAALAGTSGTPGTGNKYVTDADARNTNARAPTAHGHAESDVTNLVTDLAARVLVGGQLGGTAASPDVRGLREATGPTLLTLGAVVDGEYLKRAGNTIVSGAPGGGSGLTHGQVMSRVFLAP